MKEWLFSYGTLQKENVQIELFGRLLQGSRDVLKDHKLIPIEITDEAFLAKGEEWQQLTVTVSEDSNDAIEGTVFEITEEELHHADEYEPVNYKRIKKVLASGKEAWIYIAG